MKKIISLVVVFALAVTMLVSTAFAAGTVVYVEDVGAGAGEEVIVDVIISGNTGFGAARVELVYDSSVLTLKGITTGLLTGGAVNHEKGIVSFASATDVTGDGVLMSAIFTVASDAPDCVASVSVNVGRLSNTSSEPLNPSVAAGSVSIKAPHTHSYNKVVTAPTCTEKGYTTYTCSCGESYKADEVAALGHKYSAGETTAPTCTEQGSTRYTCSVCGHSYQDDYIDALGHKYSKPVFSWAEDYSDCTVSYSCTVCSEEFTEKCQVTSETTPATEKEKGKIVYTVTFTLDGQTYTDTKTVVLPKLEPTPGTDPEPGIQPEPGVTPDSSPVLYLMIGFIIGAGIFFLLFLLWKKKKEASEGK